MAVSKKVRPDVRGSIAPALSGDLVDFDHPSVRAWAAERDVDLTERLKERAGGTEAPTKPRREPPAKAPATTRAEAASGPRKKVKVPARGAGMVREDAVKHLDAIATKLDEGVDVGVIARMTLQEVVERWGTQAELKEWLAAVRTLEEIRAKQIKNEGDMGTLIERDYVEKHVFAHIDATNKKLLQDAPSRLANEVTALCRTGATLEDVERLIRNTVGSYLTNVKTQTVRALKNA
jgi:hypothetical protein